MTNVKAQNSLQVLRTLSVYTPSHKVWSLDALTSRLLSTAKHRSYICKSWRDSEYLLKYSVRLQNFTNIIQMLSFFFPHRRPLLSYCLWETHTHVHGVGYNNAQIWVILLSVPDWCSSLCSGVFQRPRMRDKDVNDLLMSYDWQLKNNADQEWYFFFFAVYWLSVVIRTCLDFLQPF